MTTKEGSTAPAKKLMTPAQQRGLELVLRPMTALNRWLYRLSGGKIWGRFPGGAPILLLTTTGRTSGRRRTVPLLYLQDGDDLVVVASKGGMPEHPAWFRNLEAHPEVEVQVGKTIETRRARAASPDERKRLWPRVVEMYPDYDLYQSRTEREIPVVVLSKTSASEAGGEHAGKSQRAG